MFVLGGVRVVNPGIYLQIVSRPVPFLRYFNHPDLACGLGKTPNHPRAHNPLGFHLRYHPWGFRNHRRPKSAKTQGTGLWRKAEVRQKWWKHWTSVEGGSHANIDSWRHGAKFTPMEDRSWTWCVVFFGGCGFPGFQLFKGVEFPIRWCSFLLETRHWVLFQPIWLLFQPVKQEFVFTNSHKNYWPNGMAIFHLSLEFP